MRHLLAFLLLCFTAFADNLDDTRGWPTNKLPVGAVWALGHNFQWNVQQVRDNGHRLLPTAKIPVKETLNGVNQVNGLNQWAAEFLYLSDNNLPLVLRHESQWSQEMTRDRGTYPGATAVQWRLLLDGTLDSEPQCDCFADPAMWSAMGTTYASSAYVAKLQQLCPNPAWLGLWDNNEGYYPEVNTYSLPPVALKRAWKSRDVMAGISLSMRDRVDVIGYATDAYDFWPEFYQLRRAQYASLFSAFRAGAWPTIPHLTNAYSAGATIEPTSTGGNWGVKQSIIDQIGYAPEAACYDGAGVSCYPGPNMMTNLLGPQAPAVIAKNRLAWEWNAAQNPKAFRTVFVSMSGKAALAPALAAQHEIVTPDLFKSWCEWLSWLSRPTNGGPVLLQHWIGSSTTPTTPFFDAARQAELDTLGRPDLKPLTHGEYSIAVAKVADSICRTDIRDYWREGVSVLATASHADVRVVAVKRGTTYLAYVWTPRALQGQMTLVVDGFPPVSVDMPSTSGDYWKLSPPPAAMLIPTKVP